MLAGGLAGVAAMLGGRNGAMYASMLAGWFFGTFALLAARRPHPADDERQDARLARPIAHLAALRRRRQAVSAASYAVFRI